MEPEKHKMMLQRPSYLLQPCDCAFNFNRRLSTQSPGFKMNYSVRGAYLRIWGQLHRHKTSAGHAFHLFNGKKKVLLGISSLENEEQGDEMPIKLNIKKRLAFLLDEME